MQKLLLSSFLLMGLLVGLAMPARAQIFEPEGVNLPGDWWSNFSQPPGILPLAGIQKTAPNGQFLVQTTLPTRRYHSVLKVAATGGDVVAGTYGWLFTSGSTSNYFNNKWGNVTVTPNTVQTYTLGSGTNNTATLTNGKWYTINFRDNGYANTSAAWLETASQPVSINNVSRLPVAVTTGAAATITATLDNALPGDQHLYLRYATDAAFTANHNLVLLTGSGTSWSAQVPAAFNTSGRTVRYYVFTANDNTLTNASADLDLKTIKFNNNNTSGGYSYTVTDNVTQAGATTWSTPASWTSGMVPPAGANVTIAHNLTLDQNANVANVTVAAGTFTLSDGTNRTLTVAANGSLTVATGATLAQNTSNLVLQTGAVLTNNGTITLTTGSTQLVGAGQFVNNGSYTAGTSLLQALGSVVVSGSQNTSFYDVRLAAGMNFGAAVTSTITGTLQLDAGGFVNTNAPVYAVGSVLSYASGSSAASPYGRGLEWSATTGKGYPYTVACGANTFVDLGSSSPGVLRQCGGDLVIGAGSGVLLDFSTNDMTQPLVVAGNVLLNGTLSLSDANGGDLKVQGNFTRNSGGMFSPKGRAVFFDGTALQTIQGPAGGQVNFDYLLINNNSASGVRLLSGVNVNATAGAALQINGKLDLAGNTLQLVNDTDLQVQNAVRTLTSSAGTGTLVMRSNNAVTQSGGGSLVIDASVRVVTGGAGIGPISFGGLTTINGTLELQPGGFVDGANNNGPLYGPTSTVRYNVGGNYDRRSEWDGNTTSRTPFNVQVTGNTYLNAFGSGSTGDVNVRANLTIDAGSTLDANTGTTPFAVQGNVTNAGTFKLSTNAMGGGDLQLGGSFANTGTFESNGRAVFFNGSVNQTVTSTSALAINYVVLDKSAGQVILGTNTDLTVSAPAGGVALEFRSPGPNIFNISGRTLTLGTAGQTSNAGTIAPNSGFTDTGTGTLNVLGTGDFGTLRFAAGTTLGTLSLDRTTTNAGATIAGAPVLATALTLAGDARLTLTTDNLTLAAAAMLTGATPDRYVVTAGTGALARQGVANSATVFPVGTATSFNPATLTNAGLADTYRVRVSATPALAPPHLDRQISRFWTIDEGTAGGSDVTLRLQWNQAEEGAQFVRNTSGLRMTRNSSATVPATLVVGGGMNNAGPYVAQATGIMAFSEWSVGNPNVLPVELVAFDGYMNGPDARLVWRTASEKNNARFVVERSVDARTFSAVGSVAGAGTSTEPKTYELTDANVARLGAPVLYYRLRQQDNDGTEALSAVVAVSLTDLAGTAPTIFPNPTTSDDFTVQFFAPAATTLAITLTDVRGAETYRGVVPVAQGYNYLNAAQLPGYRGLARGLYVARLVTPTGGETFIKVVRQ